MVLSNKQITNAPTRLRGCTSWFAPLLFANTKDGFFHVNAHIYVAIRQGFSLLKQFTLQDRDASYKIDLDFLNCLEEKIPLYSSITNYGNFVLQDISDSLFSE